VGPAFWRAFLLLALIEDFLHYNTSLTITPGIALFLILCLQTNNAIKDKRIQKSNVMSNSNFRQQEILLLFNTSFSDRNCYQPAKSNKYNFSENKQQLKDACWRGMVPSLLPECFDFKTDKSMHLWEINEADTFIQLKFSRFVPHTEKEFSINPYLFLSVQILN